jgi:hypothetical protein
MLVSTFVFHVIITFAMSALLHLNDDQTFDNKRKNKDNDCHDHDKFNENKQLILMFKNLLIA